MLHSLAAASFRPLPSSLVLFLLIVVLPSPCVLHVYSLFRFAHSMMTIEVTIVTACSRLAGGARLRRELCVNHTQ